MRPISCSVMKTTRMTFGRSVATKPSMKIQQFTWTICIHTQNIKWDKKNHKIALLNYHFVCIQFRVALLLSENEVIYSDTSVIISTFEEGAPESEPQIIQSSAVDQTRILLRWEAGLRNNGRVLSYDLTIKDSVSSLVALKVLIWFFFVVMILIKN